MFKKFYLSLTICFKSIFKIKGDIIDGIYNNKDSQDETELISFLGNSMPSDENIIHPYQEDVRVIFHSGNKGYKYNKLANSPTDFLTSKVSNDSDSDSDKSEKTVSNNVTVTEIEGSEIFHDSLDS